MNNSFNLTNLEKQLWPGVTKKDLITYLIYVGPTMTNYLLNRPLAFLRAPNGIDGESFFQKNVPPFAPEKIQRWEFKHNDRLTQYMLLDSVENLIYLGNLACVEIHSWLSTIDRWANPKEIVIDLDPNPTEDFSTWQHGAYLIYELLLKLKLKSYPKITGKKGVHIMIPIVPKYNFKQLSFFLKAFKELVIGRWPDLFTGELRKEKRQAPIFLDLGQNGLKKTVIAPYSPRFSSDATVAVALNWPEFLSLKSKPKWSVKANNWPPLFTFPSFKQEIPQTWIETS